jgi:hypothetical protein
MISLDMKYTSLYWALRFVESNLDIHTKDYHGYAVTIYAEEQRVNYGDKIDSQNNNLARHKDFVILECVDRLLSKNYKPCYIKILGKKKQPDIVVGNFAIFCKQWGKSYETAVKNFSAFELSDYSLIYTSRLVSGLLEYKNIILYKGKKFNYGVFEDNIGLYDFSLTEAKEVHIEQTVDIDDFEIVEDELVQYTGQAQIVKVPEGITTIGASAFWNCTSVEEIILPHTLERLGGDSFYYCTNLNKVNIPEKVRIMGNDPFAGCPNLDIENHSKYFVIENGILYNRKKDNLVHYPINKEDNEFVVPNSVICLGKHCFFNCNNLEKIVIPPSVIRFENNPFSGCEKLNLENHSSHYVIENGVIYNEFKTTIIGCLNSTEIEEFVVPEEVTLISRNSFWNCKNIKKIILTKNINRIGYNPFAGCENLVIESRNHRYKIVDGLLLNENKTELLCCTNLIANKGVKIPDSVSKINRGAFSGCKDLTKIDFNNVTYVDKSSFTNCTGLTKVDFPNRITYIGEWAFSYCSNLKAVSIHEDTVIDKNVFNECPVKITIKNMT